jgi:hypothetical protein
MNQLPFEIVHRILEYDGRIKYRHGKYMNQISQDDYRYKMLLTIPIIQPDNSFWFMMLVSCKQTKYIVENIYSKLTMGSCQY